MSALKGKKKKKIDFPQWKKKDNPSSLIFCGASFYEELTGFSYPHTFNKKDFAFWGKSRDRDFALSESC